MDITARLYELSINNNRVYNLMNQDLYSVHVESDIFYIDKQTLTAWPPKYFINWIKRITGYSYLYEMTR